MCLILLIISITSVISIQASYSNHTCHIHDSSLSLLRKWTSMYSNNQCMAFEFLLQQQSQQKPQIRWIIEQMPQTTQFPQLDEFDQVKKYSCPRSDSTNTISKFINITNDPFFPAQWYMQDCRTSENELQYDINVIPVWKENNFGQGVIVVVIDDGVETSHDDLIDNYDSNYGLDLIDRDDTPTPDYTADVEISHGTRSAGVIAMKHNNGVCGVGIAPAVTLGAVRLLAPNIRPSYDDMVQALVFKMNEIHITSNSWSVNDDGQQMPYPDLLLKTAFKATAIEGRAGKGVIHVFSVGNGKHQGDMCGCDLLLNAIYTIAVASCDYQGRINTYSERCAAIMVTAYSGDGSTRFNVISTTMNNACTIYHTGTSAAAPMVSGAIALVLHTNPALSWRDIQHLLTQTSRVAPLRRNPTSWKQNAAGFFVSEDFGFGLIDVHRLVEAAKVFQSVPPMRTCVIPIITSSDSINAASWLSRVRGFRVQFISEGCKRRPAEINFMEHVQLQVFLAYSRRGDLEIRLKSPSGTEAKLLEARRKDDSREGLRGWIFDSVMSWGETPSGMWTVDIYDRTGQSTNLGFVSDLLLVVHGTKEKPLHYGQL